MERTGRLLLVALALATVAGCARHFPGPMRPRVEAHQSEHMTVLDDGTVAWTQGRLEISLRPMSDAELNRAFPDVSNDGAESTNPFTYGDWTPLGERYTPQRFTVFLLRVKNYEFPKVHIDPGRVSIQTQNRRHYDALDLLRVSEYFRAHAQAWAGNAYRSYRESEEILRRTMFAGNYVFSGQQDEGYILFEPLPADVERVTVSLDGITLRFNHAEEPVESVSVEYSFEREIFRGYLPPAALVQGG